MKTIIFDIKGNKAKEIDLPEFFSEKIREDLIFKVLETKKTKQPYAPSPVAGKQSTAAGKVVHRRHVWRSGYGRGMARVPRKIMSRRGSQFNWIGAEVAGAVGGRRAHPPKVLSMINTKKINKKEQMMAIISALSATANKKSVAKKYESVEEKSINQLPIIVQSEFTKLKIKEITILFEKILGKLYEVSIPQKEIRAGKGKRRGRKYKKTAGMLVVLGNDESLKTKMVDVKNVKNLSVLDLAKGGPGRITIYTEKAIKDLESKLNPKESKK